ncbi:MAG: 2-dehydro-3-deoxygalactonokinase [Marinibacterium sp.]
MTGANAVWAAADWGTSNLRVWVMGRHDAVIAALTSDKGMGALAPEEFEPVLVGLLAPYLTEDLSLPVLACGMVGARQGWVEAPYRAVPCGPPGAEAGIRAPVRDQRISVTILPGLKQASPPDVMRGEETQVAGFLSARPDFDGVVCLPGTHTKWVHVSAGEIVSFRTFMTGEMFALLSRQSVLRHSLAGGGWDDTAFLEAVGDAMSAPQRLAARLFAIRAGSLLDGVPADVSRARLSGLLIGLELAGAREYWLGQEIALIGAPDPASAYRSALLAQGAVVRDAGEDAVLAGLRAAHEGQKD